MLPTKNKSNFNSQKPFLNYFIPSTIIQTQVNKILNLQTQLQDKGKEVSNLQTEQKILKQALIIMLLFGVATAIYVYKNRPAPIEPSRVEQIMPPKIPEPIKIKPKKGKKR